MGCRELCSILCGGFGGKEIPKGGDTGIHGYMGFSGDSGVKNPPTNARDERDLSLIPGSGRPPGERNGNPLQYSCLGNHPDTQLQFVGSPRVRHD